MTNILQDQAAKDGHDWPVQITDGVVGHQIQQDGCGTMTGTSGKSTRMRFYVCILGLLSLVMGQISRTVINYSITSMVDPRMLQTNSSISTKGGSCPARTIDLDDGTISMMKQIDDGTDLSEEEILLASFESEQLPGYQTALNTERIYKFDRSSREFSEDKFMWTVRQQSLIKGGFFYSYFFFMILGGRIAEVYGAKYVILMGVAGSAIINLFTPWMARNSFPMLIVSRILMGAIQAGGYPAMYALINRWLTMSEASIYAPMLKMSLRVGQVLASMAPGLMPNWPGVFYLVGLLGIVWSTFWVFLSTSDPSENKWVSQMELAHIMKNKKRKQDESTTSNGDMKTSKQSLRTPWMRILFAPSVIGLVIAKLAFSFCNSLITIEIPSYLRYVYHATMQEMSVITTVMFTIQVPLTLLAGWLAKFMVEKQPFGISTTNTRKLFQSFAMFGSAISLFLMTLSDCNLVYSGILLQVLSIFAVFVAGGETMLPYDLTEEYPATIMAIANSFGNLSGIIITSLTGLLLGSQGGSQTRWNTVIYVVIVANIIGGLVFCLIVKAKPINFDSVKGESIEDGGKSEPRKCRH